MGDPLMAASLAGSLKVLIEGGGLGLAVYRDDAGAAATDSTWVTIDEGISTTTVPLGDNGDDDAVTELIQVNLWQPWRAKAPGDPAEDYALPDQLQNLIHGATLPAPPVHVRSCKVDSRVRLLERDENLVHHAYTVRIQRDSHA